jgi:ATP-dependent Clp protease ATP-binding subunit ClpC
MYERFTDRSRRAMQLANQEAQRLNHEYIGTEHILLGLAKEGNGVAASVLKNLDADFGRIRMEIEKIVVASPEMITIGKLRQTPQAKKAIEFAIEEAMLLHHNYVGTEHLLLGLLREGEGLAAVVLNDIGLTLQGVRDEVMRILGHSKDDGPRTDKIEAAKVAENRQIIVTITQSLYPESRVDVHASVDLSSRQFMGKAALVDGLKKIVADLAEKIAELEKEAKS